MKRHSKVVMHSILFRDYPDFCDFRDFRDFRVFYPWSKMCRPLLENDPRTQKMVLLILKYINLVEKNRLWSKFDITISSLHPNIRISSRGEDNDLMFACKKFKEIHHFYNCMTNQAYQKCLDLLKNFTIGHLHLQILPVQILWT